MLFSQMEIELRRVWGREEDLIQYDEFLFHRAFVSFHGSELDFELQSSLF